MLSKGLSSKNSLTLYGVVIDDIKIDAAEMDKKLLADLGGDEALSFANIVACSDGGSPELLEEPALLMVSGKGSKDGIPKSIIEAFEVSGKDQPKLRAWTVSPDDQTMLAIFDKGSFADMLGELPEEEFMDMPEEEDGAFAIRGADGQLYLIPGHSEDYRAPAEMEDMIQQVPGESIELIEMKDLGAETSPAVGVRATMARATMARATMARATMARATMARATMARATMARATMARATMARATMARATMTRATMTRATMTRATMMRATMMRATMVTSDHEDER